LPVDWPALVIPRKFFGFHEILIFKIADPHALSISRTTLNFEIVEFPRELLVADPFAFNLKSATFVVYNLYLSNVWHVSPWLQIRPFENFWLWLFSREFIGSGQPTHIFCNLKLMFASECGMAKSHNLFLIEIFNFVRSCPWVDMLTSIRHFVIVKLIILSMARFQV
jgi:hypothetical protein